MLDTEPNWSVSLPLLVKDDMTSLATPCFAGGQMIFTSTLKSFEKFSRNESKARGDILLLREARPNTLHPIDGIVENAFISQVTTKTVWAAETKILLFLCITHFQVILAVR